jgi:trk system potassium uptake protein TrkA
MSKQIAVFGLGRFGTNLSRALFEAGYEVLAVDKVAELVENIGPYVTHAVRTNAINEAALKKLGIESFDMAVVAIGQSIQDSVMITILLKKLGVRYIVARADNELHGEILSSIGADKVIFPEKDTAIRTGPILMMKGVEDFIPLGKGAGIVKAPASPYFIGKTLGDIGFGTSQKCKAAVLMIQRGKEAIINPSPQEVVSHIDILIMVGNNSDIDDLLEKTDPKENGKKHFNGNH